MTSNPPKCLAPGGGDCQSIIAGGCGNDCCLSDGPRCFFDILDGDQLAAVATMSHAQVAALAVNADGLAKLSDDVRQAILDTKAGFDAADTKS